MVTHENFRRFLVDAEIYIDRIADMRINDMNTVLAAVRKQLLEKDGADENKLDVRTLEVAQIQETDYFSHITAEDISVILKDIREKHKSDTTTADEDSHVAEVQRQLQDAMSYEGSKEEKQLRAFLAQFGISYDRLSKEQLINLIEVLKLSPYMKNSTSLRGKGRPQFSHGKGKRK